MGTETGAEKSDVDIEENALEELEWGLHQEKPDSNKAPKGAFNKFSDAVRQMIPHVATCSLFCGGKKCKYCCEDSWSLVDQAIRGLYSHWVTPNILAMSRPITELIEKYGIIDAFTRAGIRSIVNTQMPGEHAFCGNGLHNGEFSYEQQRFMDKGVFFYNFGWHDFGVVGSMHWLLDMVKVMQYALSQGKVAVHCHAGKGRTGVLIACALVFNNRMPANEAVFFVRSKRPGSIQTANQVKCVQDFELFLQPSRVIFHSPSAIGSFNLIQYLSRQKEALHGFQGRQLRYLPKIIHVVCERLLTLTKTEELVHASSESSDERTMKNEFCEVASEGSGDESEGDSTDHNIRDSLTMPGPHQSAPALTAVVQRVIKALLSTASSSQVESKVEAYKEKLNANTLTWEELRKEDDPEILAQLLWGWLDHLKEPVIRPLDIKILMERCDEPMAALSLLEKGTKRTLTYLVEFVARLGPHENDVGPIMEKLIAVLTQKSTNIDAACTRDMSFSGSLSDMAYADADTLARFFRNLYSASQPKESQLTS